MQDGGDDRRENDTPEGANRAAIHGIPLRKRTMSIIRKSSNASLSVKCSASERGRTLMPVKNSTVPIGQEGESAGSLIEHRTTTRAPLPFRWSRSGPRGRSIPRNRVRGRAAAGPGSGVVERRPGFELRCREPRPPAGARCGFSRKHMTPSPHHPRRWTAAQAPEPRPPLDPHRRAHVNRSRHRGHRDDNHVRDLATQSRWRDSRSTRVRERYGR